MKQKNLENLNINNENKTIEKEKEIKCPDLSYKYFDPIEEFEKINKFSKEESKNLTLDEKIKIKKERLNLFKVKLEEQRAGILETNVKLETLILKKEILDRDRLNEYLADQAAIYKLSPYQLAKYRYVLDSIELQNQVINKFVEKYINFNSKEIFKEFFGVDPLGEVEIKRGILSFFVVCKDIRDFAFLYTGKDNPENIEKLCLIDGFADVDDRIIISELHGAITVVNASKSKKGLCQNEAHLEKIRIHEERHILDRLTEDIEELGDYLKSKGSEDEDEKTILEKRTKEDRLYIEKVAKKEILAYLKIGVSPEEIKTKLFRPAVEGGIYDYFEIMKDYYSSEYIKFDKKLLEKEINESRNKYKKNILKSLEKVDNLEKIGFSNEEIIGLFAYERLDKWPKIFERFTSSKEFQNRKAEKINNLKNKLDHYNRLLEKIKNKNLFKGR